MSMEAVRLIRSCPTTAPALHGSSSRRQSRFALQLRQRSVRHDESVVIAPIPAGKPKQSVWSRFWRRKHRSNAGSPSREPDQHGAKADNTLQDGSDRIPYLPEQPGASLAIASIPPFAEGWELDATTQQAGSALLSAMALGLVYGVATGMLGLLLRISTPPPPVAAPPPDVRRLVRPQERTIVPLQLQEREQKPLRQQEREIVPLQQQQDLPSAGRSDVQTPLTLLAPVAERSMEGLVPADTSLADVDSLPVLFTAGAQFILNIGASLLKIAALALPALVEIAHWLGVNVLVPLGQVLLRSGAEVARDSASLLSSEVVLPSSDGSTEEAASAVLNGTAASLDMLASAAPAIENTADYLAEKATPVAQEALRATSRLATDVARRLEVP